MATVLLWMSPESGHLIPTIKFGCDLLRRGNRVVYLTCGHIRQELASLGFETMQFFSDDDPFVAARSIFSACPPTRWMYQHLCTKFSDTAAYIRDIRLQIHRAASLTRSDLVLVDGVFDSLLNLRMSWMLRDVCPVVRIFVHLPYAGAPARKNSDHPGATIYLSPPEFEIPDLLDKSAIYTEASIFHCPTYDGGALGEWLSDDKPAIYCSLGTQAELYAGAPRLFEDMTRAALQLPDFKFVFACGSAYREEYGACAPNIYCARFVALIDVLHRAKAAIFNGGFGTLKACIAFAVPVLIIPQQWDQPANGIRVEHHGIGLTLAHPNVNVRRLCEAVRYLAEDQETANRARAMRNVFLEADRQEQTAKACEVLLSRQAPQALPTAASLV